VLDEATRAEPNPGPAGVYREMQELFDEAARDLSGVFARHRRLVSGTPS
jgi:hypothetical protein